ncbi:hypothetical protein CR158_10695 [Halomonas heilongjiangensis]|nr:hypothetical protein CR158_10695 [Halomonas heilongjiangensis]
MGLFYCGSLISFDVMSADIGDTLDIGGVRLIFNKEHNNFFVIDTFDSFDTSSHELLHQIYDEISMTQVLLPEMKIFYNSEQS